MARVNEHYAKLQAGYLFPEIGRRVRAFAEAHPDAAIIRLGIGDITLPLAPAVVEAIREAAAEMGRPDGVHGYGQDQGYAFLREAIREHDYRARGVEVELDEIFVSDGSKQDSGNIQEIFGTQCRVAVTDPVYPVYVDTNVMAGNTGEGRRERCRYEGLVYHPLHRRQRLRRRAFPSRKGRPDLPLLTRTTRPAPSPPARQLKRSGSTTRKRQAGSIILFDAAYEAFIQDPEIAPTLDLRDRRCASDCCHRVPFSFSKNAVASPAFAAPTRWCRRSSPARAPTASPPPCTRCGRGARPPSSTRCPT